MIPTYPNVDFRIARIKDLEGVYYHTIQETMARIKHTDGKWYKILIRRPDRSYKLDDIKYVVADFHRSVYLAIKLYKITPNDKFEFLDEDQRSEEQRLNDIFVTPFRSHVQSG